MKYVIYLLAIISTHLQAQTYYTFDNEGTYTLNEEWVVVDGDTLEGYWIDTVFNTKRNQYIFTDQGITKLNKLIPINMVFTGSTVGDYPYWSITKRNLGTHTETYLLGYEGFNIEPTYQMLVQNVTHNKLNNTVRGEQNGIPFYLFNAIVNSEIR